jgi:hypothetical protein
MLWNVCLDHPYAMKLSLFRSAEVTLSSSLCLCDNDGIDRNLSVTVEWVKLTVHEHVRTRDSTDITNVV